MNSWGVLYQFGTKSAGCPDALFTLRALLQERREKHLDTHVAFIDLVKAYDSVDHTVIYMVLHRIGVPSDLIAVIKKLYSDFHWTLKIGKASTAISSGCSVRQGDNLAPILFIIVMQAMSSVLYTRIQQRQITIPSYQHVRDWSGKLRHVGANTTTSHLPWASIFLLLYVDDDAMLFISCDDL